MKQTSTATRTSAPALTPRTVQSLQRQCACGQHASGGECEGCKAKRRRLGRHRDHRAQETLQEEHHRTLEQVRSPLRGGGRPLETPVRTEMESRFQHDFSRVRVHTDAGAAASARDLQAHAWALGNDLVFAHGAYDPYTAKGQKLLAHELAHVVQQSGAAAHAPQAELEVSHPDDAAEREAEAAAEHVMRGEPARVAQSGEGDVVHRASDLVTGLGIAGGIVGGIGAIVGLGYLIDWLVSDTDASKIDHPPQCGEKQNKKIQRAFAGAVKQVTGALGKLRAFTANPKAKDSGFVRDRLQARFKSETPETVGKVMRVTMQIERLLTSNPLPQECHGSEDSTCNGFAAAYVPGDGSKVVFCASFFKPDSSTADTVVHEHAHAVTGGEHITDRAYKQERVIRMLSTDEALSNAESYSEFIQEISEGSTVSNPVPTDKENCPEATKPMVESAIARAERMNTNAENMYLKNETVEIDLRTQHLPKTLNAPDPATPAGKAVLRSEALHVADVLKKTSDEFNSSIEVTCAGAGPECPKGARATFTPGKTTIFVCQAWLAEADADVRATDLLAAVYGALGKEPKADWQVAIAVMAAKLTKESFGPPVHADVVGDAAWTRDMLKVQLGVEHGPMPGYSNFEESAATHTRLSQVAPEYKGKDPAGLPFDFYGVFFVDENTHMRPAPFTPPVLAMEYTYSEDGKAQDAANSGKAADRNPRYQGKGVNLASTLTDNTVKLRLHGLGTFSITMRMDDPDTGGMRLYQDTFRVRAENPAVPAATPAPVGP